MSDTVYMIRDIEHPEVGAYHQYCRTLEEAQERLAKSKRFSREHPEPDGLAGEEYLEIVVQKIDWIPCKTCGGHVTAKDPVKYPYCRSCHYMGTAEEDVREVQLYDFRVAVPECDIGIEHTGGGCMWLAFRHPDRREFLIATDGDACLPDDDDGNAVRDGWGCVMLQQGCATSCNTGGECDGLCDGYMELLWRRDEDGDEGDQWCVRNITDAEIIEQARKWVDGEIEFVAA